MTLPVRFDALAPQVVDGVRALNDPVLQKLADDIQATVRAYVEDGLRRGLTPPQIAKGLREVLGLAPNQWRAVENFRRLLETRDSDALTRLLRDKRFDATIRKAFAGDGLTPAQIDKYVAAYQQRFLAHNAETVTRTVALDAQKLGQQLAWGQTVGRGFKRWSGTLDDRERDSHLAMEGNTVPWDQPYDNGQQFPGQGEYGCRCVSVFTREGTSQPGAGAAGVATDDLRVGELLRG